MFELYNNVLVVESSALEKDEMNHLRRTQQINIVRRGCRNRTALIAYDSLPARIQERIKEQTGVKNPYQEACKKVRTTLLEQYIEHNAAVSEWFEDYILPNGKHLPVDRQREYYNNAIILDAIDKMLDNKKAIRASKGKALKIKWKEISEGVAMLDSDKYPHTLPFNERRLQDALNAYTGKKADRYGRTGNESLISRKYANTNRAKVDDDVKKSVLFKLCSKSNNLDNEQIADVYNTLAKEAGWETITGSTVGVWRDKLSLESYAGRRGTAAFGNNKAMQVKRSAPTQPLYYWTLDGWEVELMYQKTDIVKGKRVTTYHNRPTVVVVLDACLKYPIGYAIGTHETTSLIKKAMRNALKHSEELFGKMYRPHQIQSDNYGHGALTPMYSDTCTYYTPAKVGNAKSKIIEPYFATINKKYCQPQFNWSGFNVTADKDNQPNTEYLQKYKKDFPDFEGVCRQIETMIMKERMSIVGKMLELWHSMPEDKKVEMSLEKYLLHYGDNNGYTQRLTGNGLNITIAGQKRVYDSFDIEFRKHGSVDWAVYYDKEDLSKALAVNADGTLRYMLEEKYVQPMALMDRQEGDAEQLAKVWQYNERLKEYVIDVHTQADATLREASIENPRISDTLSKLMITDSTGQHKNVKSRLRLTEATAEVVEDTASERKEWLRSKVNLEEYI
ncbi:MAG: hypothetical protein Q4A56_01845 [Porphyromonadaceae bacterium]|nr:hypothetical protein [Porphyromonadaceae bacterium]